MKKKIPFKKGKLVNINELNAYKVAYGKRLDKRDFIYFIGMPTVLFASISFLVTYYWWVSLTLGILGAFYGLTILMPKSIKKNYREKSYNQRNKFVNNMAHILTNENKTIVQALSVAADRADGELKQDILHLYAKLNGANNTIARTSFAELEKKYSEDVVFGQFIEQLETAFLEGRTNIETLKDLKTHHNQLQDKRSDFEKAKRQHVKDFNTLGSIVIVMILAITFSFSYDRYVSAYAHALTGWITNTIFLAILFKMYTGLLKKTFDDSITEVKI